MLSFFASHLSAMIVLLSLPALATLIYLSYRWRLRQIVREMEARLQERLAERERIARSLHDTLLQGVQGAILFLQMAVDKVPVELPARGALDRALSYIEDALVEGRDQVMGLRASICGNGGLAEALSRWSWCMVTSTSPSSCATTASASAPNCCGTAASAITGDWSACASART